MSKSSAAGSQMGSTQEMTKTNAASTSGSQMEGSSNPEEGEIVKQEGEEEVEKQEEQPQ